MSIVDFTEIPKAQPPSTNQEGFELFARDFLEALGFKVEEGPDRGADEGRDLIVSESSSISMTDKRWVVSIKHKAHSNKAVSKNDEVDILGRVRFFNTHGFMAFYSTIPSSGLSRVISKIQEKDKVDVHIYA